MAKRIKMIIYEDMLSGALTVEEFTNEPIPPTSIRRNPPKPKPRQAKPKPQANGTQRHHATSLPEAVQKVLSDGKGRRPREIQRRMANKWFVGKDRPAYLASMLGSWARNGLNDITRVDGLYYYIPAAPEQEGGE
jgi:hypothetical protein